MSPEFFYLRMLCCRCQGTCLLLLWVSWRCSVFATVSHNLSSQYLDCRVSCFMSNSRVSSVCTVWVKGTGIRSWQLSSNCRKWTERFWSVPEWLEQTLQRREPSNQCGFHSTVTSCVPNGLKRAFLTIFSAWVIHTALILLCQSSPIQNTVVPNKQTWLYASCQQLKEIWWWFFHGY